jgi:hypothetical protein
MLVGTKSHYSLGIVTGKKIPGYSPAHMRNALPIQVRIILVAQTDFYRGEVDKSDLSYCTNTYAMRYVESL